MLSNANDLCSFARAQAYVLGFRYDCEATAQVWSSCADIEVAAGES